MGYVLFQKLHSFEFRLIPLSWINKLFQNELDYFEQVKIPFHGTFETTFVQDDSYGFDLYFLLAKYIYITKKKLCD